MKRKQKEQEKIKEREENGEGEREKKKKNTRCHNLTESILVECTFFSDRNFLLLSLFCFLSNYWREKVKTMRTFNIDNGGKDESCLGGTS